MYYILYTTTSKGRAISIFYIFSIWLYVALYSLYSIYRSIWLHMALYGSIWPYIALYASIFSIWHTSAHSSVHSSVHPSVDSKSFHGSISIQYTDIFVYVYIHTVYRYLCIRLYVHTILYMQIYTVYRYLCICLYLYCIPPELWNGSD